MKRKELMNKIANDIIKIKKTRPILLTIDGIDTAGKTIFSGAQCPLYWIKSASQSTQQFYSRFEAQLLRMNTEPVDERCQHMVTGIQQVAIRNEEISVFTRGKTPNAARQSHHLGGVASHYINSCALW